MTKSHAILYSIFLVVFLAMHIVGVIVSPFPYIINAAITFIVVFTLLITLDKWYSKQDTGAVLANLGFKKAHFREIAKGILISVFLLLMYPVIGFMLGAELKMNDQWIPNITGLFLTAGICEEMFFRGYLFRHLREEMSFRKSAWISAGLFTAAHLLMFAYMEFSISFFSTILAAAISIPMAYLFEAGGNSVWSPAILHTAVRTIGLVITVPEEFLAGTALIWMICSMIIPFLLILPDRNFWEIWRRGKYGS